MSTFTGRELEFLAGLNRSWWTLYWREIASLCRNKDAAPNAEQDVHPASSRSNGLVRRSTPHLRACEEGACPFRRREETGADRGGVLHRRVELAVANR
jgi:hypothetical protein